MRESESECVRERTEKKRKREHIYIYTCVYAHAYARSLFRPPSTALSPRIGTLSFSLTTHSHAQKTKVVKVIEGARTSNLIIHMLILLSLLITPVLTLIPSAVLYGVFLFMGVGSIAGNELFDRLALLTIWVPKDYPKYEYTKRVGIWAMHSFTAFQVVMLIILFVMTRIKSLSVVFPFFIGLLVPIRWGMNRFWKKEDLKWLDA